MKITGIQEIPAGLIKKTPDPRLTIDNVELRATFDKAVEDAKLNVTERMALNKKFFPNGGGFELFPSDIRVPQFNFFYKPGELAKDSFTREIESVKIPEDISIIKEYRLKSSKGCFQTNLDNALKKLKKVLKNDI